MQGWPFNSLLFVLTLHSVLIRTHTLAIVQGNCWTHLSNSIDVDVTPFKNLTWILSAIVDKFVYWKPQAEMVTTLLKLA